MCGFIGVLNFNKKNIDINLKKIQNLNSLIRHRGPDSFNTESIGNCSLSHTRLSILDLSKNGNQPMFDEFHNIMIAYNGEIYNFEDLAKEFQLKEKYLFKSKTDTEVILYLYKELGIKFLDKLNGMFAIAIWDNQINQIILARDSYGVKPLFYCYDNNNNFWFSSEIKPLLKIKKKDITENMESIYHYFSYGYIPDKFTAFKEIQELRPANYYNIKIKNNKFFLKNKNYKTFDYCKNKNLSLRNIKSTSKALLYKSVERQLRSDVPVGVMLSGGLDSSALAVIVSEIRGDSNFDTFSLKFNESSFDESKYASIVANKLGTKHHIIEVTPEKIKNNIEKVISHIQEPYADGAAIPTYLLSEKAKKFVKVLLSGEGGDEIFCGYDTYSAYLMRNYFKNFPNFVLGSFSSIFSHLPVSNKKLSFEFKIKRFLKGIKKDTPTSHFFWRHIFNEDDKNKLLNINVEDLEIKKSSLFFSNKYNEFDKNIDSLSRLQFIDVNYHLADDLMIKNDRMTMAHSLEARVPFTDNELFNYLNNISTKYKISIFNKKLLLKDILKNKLPNSIVNKKKVGLEMPYSIWIKNELNDMTNKYLNYKSVSEIPILNYYYIEKIINDHLDNLEDNGRKIWSLINYVIWYKIFISKKIIID